MLEVPQWVGMLRRIDGLRRGGEDRGIIEAVHMHRQSREGRGGGTTGTEEGVATRGNDPIGWWPQHTIRSIDTTGRKRRR